MCVVEKLVKRIAIVLVPNWNKKCLNCSKVGYQVVTCCTRSEVEETFKDDFNSPWANLTENY